MVRIGIVGFGFMGRVHFEAYRRIPGARVVSLCDAEAKALEGSAGTSGNITATAGGLDLSGLRLHQRLDGMLAEGGLDAVDVCLPTDLHPGAVRAALAAGCHVFCEKPLALTAREADGLAAAARASGRLVTVGQCLRYWPAYVEAKRIVDSGRHGRVRYAEFSRLSALPAWAARGWFADPARSGGAALDLHIHDADMVLHLFGLPRSVSSAGVPDSRGGFGLITTRYDFDGLTAVATGGWICAPGFPFLMRMLLVLERATVTLDLSRTPMLEVHAEGGSFAPALAGGDGYLPELADFVEGIERGRLSGRVTVEAAAAAVRLCEEEIRSAREGRAIDLEARDFPGL